MDNFNEKIDKLSKLNFNNLYDNDFLLTWDKSLEELQAIWEVADILREFRENNISTKVFDSGLAISIFRDNSTRTRFSFASACNLLGLAVRDLDENKSQIAHGETIRETANMISFMADIIGIRDDMYIGKGHTYQKEVSNAVKEGFEEGTLEQKPKIINLQCDIDHPTQVMADALHIIHEFGGIDNLKNKKIAMTWAYSPSYGKPLSVPQGVIGLFTRLGLNVSLAYPEGYELMPEVVDIAKNNAKENNTEFKVTNDMKEAFEGADIVYPKSWAPFKAMEKRTLLYSNNDFDGIKMLEKQLLKQNEEYINWTCSEELMKHTKNENGLYLHCLPADITGVSCKSGEVDGSVFDRYRTKLYKEASYKPYIIASMIFLSILKNPIEVLQMLKNNNTNRLLH